jgi:hypothetical protein
MMLVESFFKSSSTEFSVWLRFRIGDMVKRVEGGWAEPNTVKRVEGVE